MTFAAQPQNEIRSSLAKLETPKDSNKFALLQHPDRRNRSHVKNWGQHPRNMVFHLSQVKPPRKVTYVDAADAAKTKTKTKSESAICKGIKHFDRAINRPSFKA